MLNRPDLPILANSKRIIEIRFVRDGDSWRWLVIDEDDRLYLDHGEFKSLDSAVDDLRSIKGFA